MTPPPALANYLLALADDELILAHRNSEWSGHAPILEEDIAFSNIALDEMGHANLWYQRVQDLTGQAPDELAFFRETAGFRCAQLVELPKGDWAFSMLRQFLFDAAEAVRLPALAASTWLPLAETAAKIRTEEIYHYRHTQAWVKRLGQGTDESRQRLQTALDTLWSYALQLFVPLSDEAALAAEGLVPTSQQLQPAWEDHIRPILSEAGLIVPATTQPAATDRTRHSEHLPPLLAEMQEVARLEAPGIEW
jgi:ring-1,2-phenylacetyl-CoA epoxidase subunit PaaC